jgi:hypothetical protein
VLLRWWVSFLGFLSHVLSVPLHPFVHVLLFDIMSTRISSTIVSMMFPRPIRLLHHQEADRVSISQDMMDM